MSQRSAPHALWAALAFILCVLPAHARAGGIECPGTDTTLVQQFYESALLKSEFCESQGLREGPSRTLFSNGNNKSLGTYHHGQMSEHWIRWYENGTKKDEGAWENGVPQGDWQSWYPDGRPKSKGRIQEGAPVCSWDFWDPRGVRVTKQESPAETCTGTGATGLAHGWDFFEVSWIGVFQRSGGQSFSPQLGWLPTFDWGGAFAIRGDLDVSLLKNPSTLFVALSPQILIQYRSQCWAAELGGGAQSWLASGGGTAPMASAKLSWLKSWKWIEREFLRYSVAPVPSGDFSQEISLGVGLSI